MTNPAIETEGLTKHYGSVTALQDLDLTVERGEVFGILGPNGAGKTTTIRLLLALARPTSGRARILGFDSWREAVRAHRQTAYVAGELALWPQLTGAQTLDLLGHLHGSFDSAYCDELTERFELDPRKRVRSYSTGNRQKVGLIAAFMVRPELLILDEPTAGLDPLMVQVFRECIGEARDNGQTVFVSSHVLSEMEAICDRVGILRAGQLIDSGSLDDLRHLSARRIEAQLAGPIPDLSSVKGVTGVTITDGVLHCYVSGSMQEFIRLVAEQGVIEMTATEPSLEEVFLAHYGAEQTRINDAKPHG